MIDGRAGACTRLALTAALGLASTARAEVARDAVTSGDHDSDEAPRTYAALRMGASTGNLSGQPEVCGEIAPVAFVSVVACGTGSGLWTASPGREISHYRVDVHLPSTRVAGVFLKPLVGAGFSEMQLAADDAGFRFTSTGARGLETAGPSVAGTLRGALPLGAGFEGLADLTLGVAYFAEAPRLLQPQQALQPFLSVGVGAGF